MRGLQSQVGGGAARAENPEPPARKGRRTGLLPDFLIVEPMPAGMRGDETYLFRAVSTLREASGRGIVLFWRRNTAYLRPG